MKVALVTGASRGLGAAIAERLGADGFAVAVNYARSSAQADEVVTRIRAAGSAAEAFQADVTDEAAVAELVANVRDSLGDVHTLVLNATGPSRPPPSRSSPGRPTSTSSSSSSRARSCSCGRCCRA